MHIDTIPFSEVPYFSSRDKAYIHADHALRPFYKYPVELDVFPQVIADKKQDKTDRTLLVEVLKEQYAAYPDQPVVNTQIDRLLEENTFTLVTAHQPSLFTGPLYYIYKICSTIHLARKLATAYPDYHFVPVFISGGEDHDFEEVNHLQLFGKTISWESGETGPVGRMKTATLTDAIAQLEEIMGTSDQARQINQLIREVYSAHKFYGPASLDLVHRLLGKEGLVVLNMDHPRLKERFIPFIKKEVFEMPSQQLVEQATAQLEAAGFSGQAYPREINFFYLQDQQRERIVLEGDHYRVLNTELQFSRADLEKEIEAHPERFSPNVVMRPIYQECILPNLAYIGGGGELAYWLERKEQFSVFGVNFPMLIRRSSVLWVDNTAQKRLQKLDLNLKDLFGNIEAVVKSYVREQTDQELSLAKEKEALKGVFKQILEKAKPVDPTLLAPLEAEQAKTLNSLSKLEGRLIKAEKQRFETSINQLRSMKEKLFPDNGLQERYDNFLAYYLRYGDTYFQTLLESLNPLEKEMIVIYE